MSTGLGWVGIVRLGLVQASIGAIVMLTTSLLNRVIVVEYALAAAIPAGLVAWHYAVQLARPVWGHGSDRGRRRTPWIHGGMAMLALGALVAINATVAMGRAPVVGVLIAIVGFTMIGCGVGAAGTSLLALLAASVAPERRAAAAAITWIMMVAGIVVAAAIAGSLLDPFSAGRLALVAGGIVAGAFLLPFAALLGLERNVVQAAPSAARPPARLATALREISADGEASRFALFVFVSMLAYSMQDLILEPFAGLVFAATPGESTALAGAQHAGVLVGMIAAGIGGSGFAGGRAAGLERWILAGCAGSALALAGLAAAATWGPGWPLVSTVVALGAMNGLFAVAAIGMMMGLAGGGRGGREGVRMGVWGAAQAIAFGAGGLAGAVGVDLIRGLTGAVAPAFQIIFALDAALFILAAVLALRVAPRPERRRQATLATG